MAQYEYKVVPAPAKAQKAKGVKTAEGRFAHTVEAELNRLAADGWEYQRAELLPHEERSGLTATQTKWRTVMVFRRLIGPVHAADEDEPAVETPVIPAVAPPMTDTFASDPPLTASDAPGAEDGTVVPLHAEADAEDEMPQTEVTEDDTPPR